MEVIKAHYYCRINWLSSKSWFIWIYVHIAHKSQMLAVVSCCEGVAEWHALHWNWLTVYKARQVRKWVGLTGTALTWFNLHSQYREHFVLISNLPSDQINITCSSRVFSQASSIQDLYVLLLFRLWNIKISHADDTQLYMTTVPYDCQISASNKSVSGCQNFLLTAQR